MWVVVVVAVGVVVVVAVAVGVAVAVVVAVVVGVVVAVGVGVVVAVVVGVVVAVGVAVGVVVAVGVGVVMILGIVQARMKSTRLPGKVARLMSGKSMLGRVICQALFCKMIDRVVVVTSKSPEDDAVEFLARTERVDTIRTEALLPDGTNDVLSWFVNVARTMKEATHFVRITGDCPLWCPLLGAEVIAHHLAHDRAYTSNVGPALDGFDTEVFTRRVLFDAHVSASRCYDRHHVTPWMRGHIPAYWIDHLLLVGGRKLSVDTQEDFDRCEEIARDIELHGCRINSRKVIALYDRKGYPLCNAMPSPSPTSNGPKK